MAQTGLIAALDGYTRRQGGESPYFTEIEGLILLRADGIRPPSHIISRPALCLVVQGAKRTSFGDETHAYGPGEAMIVTVEMPSVGRVVEASPGAPFLGVVVELDAAILRSVLDELARPPQPAPANRHAALVVALAPEIEDCVLRLVRLLERPEAMGVLAPLLKRELAYWLLSGPSGGVLAEMTFGRERSGQILRAIRHLRDHFAESLPIAALAGVAQLSASAFHRQFKAMTGMTPLQYQKQLRLLEARRMILSDRVKAETAAYATGYESASQFSRDYARMFGRPPRRDAELSPGAGHWA